MDCSVKSKCMAHIYEQAMIHICLLLCLFLSALWLNSIIRTVFLKTKRDTRIWYFMLSMVAAKSSNYCCNYILTCLNRKSLVHSQVVQCCSANYTAGPDQYFSRSLWIKWRCVMWKVSFVVSHREWSSALQYPSALSLFLLIVLGLRLANSALMNLISSKSWQLIKNIVHCLSSTKYI